MKMDLKLNFESEEEMIEYLKQFVSVEYESGYYCDGSAIAKLGSHEIGSTYIPGCNCSNGDD